MDKYIWPGGSSKEINEWHRSNKLDTCDLDAIGKKYNADKASTQWMSWGIPGNGNVPHDWPASLILPIVGHNYLSIYSKYFEENRFKPLRILEIGMGVYPWNGYSMRMWLEYFPNLELHIVDYKAENFNCNFYYDKERVHFHICDQSNNQSLTDFSNKMAGIQFDYIIDDGSHIADHQYQTLKSLFALLKYDGKYFIEDIHDDSFREYLLKLFDSVNYGNLAQAFISTSEDIQDISSIEIHRSLLIISKGAKITR